MSRIRWTLMKISNYWRPRQWPFQMTGREESDWTIATKKKTIYRTPRLNKKKLAKFKKSLHQEYSTTQLQKRRRGDIGRTSYSWWTSITSRMSHHFRNISVCFWIISVNFRSMSTWESYQKTSVDFWSLMNTESYYFRFLLLIRRPLLSFCTN